MKNHHKLFQGIPIVQSGQVKSGEKYQTDIGFSAVKNGQKQRRDSKPIARGNKPKWLRAKMPLGSGYSNTRKIVGEHRLSTVCEESMCPNIGECWNAGTATIMVMGSVCTRACRFCAVDTGNPKGWLDTQEPRNSAKAVKLMGLKYVVITSVDRDDLADGGALHYATCVKEIKKLNPNTAVEALTPDFNGIQANIELVVDSGLEVFAQNVETVKTVLAKRNIESIQRLQEYINDFLQKSRCSSISDEDRQKLIDDFGLQDESHVTSILMSA